MPIFKQIALLLGWVERWKVGDFVCKKVGIEWGTTLYRGEGRSWHSQPNDLAGKFALNFLQYRFTINIVICHTKFGGQTKGIVKERISLYLESL
jgi:hypothetical protein